MGILEAIGMARALKIDDVLLERILERLNGLEYGSVLITVHDGKIVQIDRTERKRYQDQDHAHVDTGQNKSFLSLN
jgi:hypothetical protein